MSLLVDPFGLIGQVLDGQFRVDKFVGEGGFSVVYRGHHIGLDEPIAIKCLKLPMALGSALVESFVRRFKDEGRLHYRLSQGNLYIVRSLASGTSMAPATGALVPYIVLEWLEGRSLANDLEVRRTYGDVGRSLVEVVRILDPAVDALAYAHAQGVVHRDVNPGNLFFTQTAQGVKLKVLDFGVAKIVIDHLALGPREKTIGQIRIFSPSYAAPEQFDESLGSIGTWTDVYALALVATELLRDAPAVEGDNLGEHHARAMDPQRRPTPRTLGVKVGDAVEAAFGHALALLPGDRPNDVGEFWGELKNAMQRDAAATRIDYAATPRAPDPPPETVHVPEQPTEPNLRMPTGINELMATLRVDAPSERAEMARSMRDGPGAGPVAPVAGAAGFRGRSDSEPDRGVPSTARMPDAPRNPARPLPRPGVVDGAFPPPIFTPPPPAPHGFDRPSPPSFAVSSGTPTADPTPQGPRVPEHMTRALAAAMQPAAPPESREPVSAMDPTPSHLVPPTVPQFMLPAPRSPLPPPPPGVVRTPFPPPPPEMPQRSLSPMPWSPSRTPPPRAAAQAPLSPPGGAPPIPNAFEPSRSNAKALVPTASWYAPVPAYPPLAPAPEGALQGDVPSSGDLVSPGGSPGQPPVPEPGQPAFAPYPYQGVPVLVPPQNQQKPLAESYPPLQPAPQGYGQQRYGGTPQPAEYYPQAHPRAPQESMSELPTVIGPGVLAPPYPSAPPAVQGSAHPTVRSTRKKGSRGLLTFVLVLLVLASLGVGGGWYANRRFELHIVERVRALL